MTSFENVTPVLFLVFNNPDVTRAVFQAIRLARPSRLYVACDGARTDRPTETERVSEARRLVVEGVDWDCEVKTLFRDKNLGPGLAVSQAITWFFEHEPEGIILEHDTLPDPTFFRFCQELLERYRHDTRIMQVCGYNLVTGQVKSSTSYYASHLGYGWGWASWARAWKSYDITMALWPSVRDSCVPHTYPFTPLRNEQFEENYRDSTTWDIQWGFAQSIHSGFSLVPRVNLVRNIGFGKEWSAHCTNADAPEAVLASQPMEFPLRHPQFIFPHRDYEKALLKEIESSKARFLRKILPLPVFRTLKGLRNAVRERLSERRGK